MPRYRPITSPEAVRLANEKRARLSLLPSEAGDKQLDEPGSSSANEVVRKAPPRLRQPARGGKVLPAPKAELQAHKAAFREVFGETLSDEFVDEMLAQLDSALAPGPWDELDPGTLNAAIATIASVKPQTELEALLAVQIVATGFAGLKFLQRGQSHLEEVYIDVYGGYATRLLRLQIELIQALDKHRRGPKQTVQARDVHIHSGAQGGSASSIQGRTVAVDKMAARRWTIHRNQRANTMRSKLLMHLTPRCGARTRGGRNESPRKEPLIARIALHGVDPLISAGRLCGGLPIDACHT